MTSNFPSVGRLLVYGVLLLATFFAFKIVPPEIGRAHV